MSEPRDQRRMPHLVPVPARKSRWGHGENDAKPGGERIFLLGVIRGQDEFESSKRRSILASWLINAAESYRGENPDHRRLVIPSEHSSKDVNLCVKRILMNRNVQQRLLRLPTSRRQSLEAWDSFESLHHFGLCKGEGPEPWPNDLHLYLGIQRPVVTLHCAFDAQSTSECWQGKAHF